MTGADKFVEECQDIIDKKVYCKEFMPELMLSGPLDNETADMIDEEMDLRPRHEIKIYRPTGSKLHGYFEYAFHKTITR